MKTADTARRGPVYFCFADPIGFSGQKAATELVINGLNRRGWLCRRLPQPVFDRDSPSRMVVLRYVWQTLWAWTRAFRLLGARGGWLCVNLGQTRAAFLRDAVPLLLGRAGFGRARVVVSLHGSLFMRWTDDSLELRVFLALLRNAGTVTVLGERQRMRLISLGVPGPRVRIVINSCEITFATIEGVVAKHARALADANCPVQCLHLSSLIDTKGYPEFLEGLRLLAGMAGARIDAVLCGCLAQSEFSERFPDLVAAEQWIENEMGEINRSARVRVRWIKGAAGADKAALFRDADIFVLPTRYAVEAQPLVLLEAMASGCAIVTTAAGEIPTILDERTAAFVEVSAEAVAALLQTLAADPLRRARLATAAHARFVDRYQVGHHLDAWESLLGASHPKREFA